LHITYIFYIFIDIKFILKCCFRLPYLFRLRQCIADYYTKATKSERTKSLLNAIKYGTSIPVYVLSGYYSWIKSDIKSTSEKELLDPMYKHAKIVFTLWYILIILIVYLYIYII